MASHYNLREPAREVFLSEISQGEIL
jgi:hypothetical protein